MNNRKKIFPFISGAILILLLIFGFFFLKERFSSSEKGGIEPKVLATADINRSFSFSAQDKTGEENAEVSFTLTSAKKVKKIAVKGSPIEAQEGKAFLVLDFELENQTAEALFLYPPDFVRLIGEDEKKFAPDFLNEVAQVEPISVKKDQMGFIVSEKENHFAVLVGEIEKEKEKVEINF